jgi:hypothetical protein
MTLPKATRKRIEQDASKWSEDQYGHDDVNMDYLEGALHEAGKASGLLAALNEIANGADFPRVVANKAIAEYNKKEAGNG